MNFTRAAEELNLTTGAVSQQIRQLEDRLGYLLFNRLGRRVTLTPEGEELRDSAAAAFAQIGETIARLNKEARPLLVSCAPSFAHLWLMPRLPRYYEANPDADIKLVAEFQAIDRSSLAVGSIDVAIRFDKTAYSGFDAPEIMQEYILPLASPAYLRSKGPHLLESGFAGATLLHDAFAWEGAEPRTEWNVWLSTNCDVKILSERSREFNVFVLAVSAALHGQGVCMARTALVLDHVQNGKLINFTHKPVPAPASYKLLTTRPDDPRIASLREWLIDECRRTESARDDLFGIIK